jgi:hypothetical protein
VCSNEWSEDDGRVVAIDHGCGAHSETRAPTPAALWDATEPVIDEWDIQIIGPRGEDGENAADPDDGAAESSRPARQRRRTTRRATDASAEGEASTDGDAPTDAGSMPGTDPAADAKGQA